MGAASKRRRGSVAERAKPAAQPTSAMSDLVQQAKSLHRSGKI
ncbi:MAG: hypothetical protein JWN51_1957, partial [Phycisphaerales bacterium]|nr:hypothetical protein [Phycisphaerales bacterium]